VADHDPIKLGIIFGSNREGRFGEIVGRWFVGQASRRENMFVDVIDLLHVDLPMRLSRDRTPAVRAYVARLDRADAFVIITPEYNHGYPAGLKQAIDVAHEEWRAKPVAFVSYGGMSGGLRAVEQLRQVFAELHTMTIRDTVSFHNVWPLFDELSGEPVDARQCNAAADLMLDQLCWWATALRAARRRSATPVPG
jgi:NAD(P)H-dependent FMN reductase